MKVSHSGFSNQSVSGDLLPFVPLILILCLFISLSSGALYVFTAHGRLARSTDDGGTWSWVSTPLPGSDCVDMCSDPAHYIYILTRTGEVHRSSNYGFTWTSRGNIPVSDASAIWVITGLTLVVTESGDFYQRDNASGNWSLLGNVGASDCVDLAPHPTSGFLVFTRSGDVWQVNTAPFSRSLLGNIGSSSVAGATTISGAVIAVTEEGDVARSTNGGSNWTWVGMVSQLSITGITNKGNNVYLTTNAGEVVRSTNQGTNWFWRGNVSQVGIKGSTSDSISVIGVEENAEIEAIKILSIYPNPATGRFTVRYAVSHSGTIEVLFFDILGRLVERCWQGEVRKGNNFIEIEQDIKGIYFLMIKSSKAKAIRKVVLE